MYVFRGMLKKNILIVRENRIFFRKEYIVYKSLHEYKRAIVFLRQNFKY